MPKVIPPFDYKNLTGKDHASAMMVKAFVQHKADVASIEGEGKIKRMSGVAYKELALAMADSQQIILRIKDTGDVFQVLVNNKVVPIKNQDNIAKAVIEIVDRLDAGRAAFQKAMLRKKVEAPMPKGIKTAAANMILTLQERVPALKAEIEAVRAERTALQEEAFKQSRELLEKRESEPNSGTIYGLSQIEFIAETRVIRQGDSIAYVVPSRAGGELSGMETQAFPTALGNEELSNMEIQKYVFLKLLANKLEAERAKSGEIDTAKAAGAWPKVREKEVKSSDLSRYLIEKSDHESTKPWHVVDTRSVNNETVYRFTSKKKAEEFLTQIENVASEENQNQIKSQSVDFTGNPAETATEDAGKSNDGITVIPGKMLIKGKFLALIGDVSVPGGPWDTESAARDGAKAWKQQLEASARASTAEIARRDALADRLLAGEEVSDAQIESLGLKIGFSDVRWFFPVAANLFGLTSRQIRPLVKSLIRTSYTVMGTERELVPTRRALVEIANAQTKTDGKNEQQNQNQIKNEEAVVAPSMAENVPVAAIESNKPVNPVKGQDADLVGVSVEKPGENASESNKNEARPLEVGNSRFGIHPKHDEIVSEYVDEAIKNSGLAIAPSGATALAFLDGASGMVYATKDRRYLIEVRKPDHISRVREFWILGENLDDILARAKNRVSASYQSIQNARTGKVDSELRRELENAFGKVFDYDISNSKGSKSAYITHKPSGIKIRVSDHDLPDHYENSADLDLRIDNGDDVVEELRNAIKNKDTPSLNKEIERAAKQEEPSKLRADQGLTERDVGASQEYGTKQPSVNEAKELPYTFASATESALRLFRIAIGDKTGRNAFVSAKAVEEALKPVAVHWDATDELPDEWSEEALDAVGLFGDEPGGYIKGSIKDSSGEKIASVIIRGDGDAMFVASPGHAAEEQFDPEEMEFGRWVSKSSKDASDMIDKIKSSVDLGRDLAPIDAYKQSFVDGYDAINDAMNAVDDDGDAAEQIAAVKSALKNADDGIKAAKKAAIDAGFDQYGDEMALDEFNGLYEYGDKFDEARKLIDELSRKVVIGFAAKARVKLATIPKDAPIEDYAALVFRANGIDVADGNDMLDGFIRAIREKQADRLRGTLATGVNNNASKEVFERATGIKLGKTQKERGEQIDAYAGITPEKREAMNKQRDEDRAMSDSIKDVNNSWDALKTRLIRNTDGEVISAQKWIIDKFSDGYTDVGAFKQGVATVYGMTGSGKGHQFIKDKEFTAFMKAAKVYGGLGKALGMVGALLIHDAETVEEDDDDQDGEIARLFAPNASNK